MRMRVIMGGYEEGLKMMASWRETIRMKMRMRMKINTKMKIKMKMRMRIRTRHPNKRRRMLMKTWSVHEEIFPSSLRLIRKTNQGNRT